jgi:hypothetical protein
MNEKFSFLKEELNKEEIKEVFVNLEGRVFFRNDFGEVINTKEYVLSEQEKIDCINYFTSNNNQEIPKNEDFLKLILPDGNFLFAVFGGKISSNCCFTIIKPATEKNNFYKNLSIKQKEFLEKSLQNNINILVVGTNEKLNIQFMNTLLKIQSDIDEKLAKVNRLNRILVVDDIGELFYKNENSMFIKSLNSKKTMILKNAIPLFKPEKTFVSKVVEDEDIITYFRFILSADIIHTSIKISDFEILNLKYPAFYKEIESEEILVIKVDGKPKNGKPIDFEFYHYKNNKKEKIEFTNQ